MTEEKANFTLRRVLEPRPISCPLCGVPADGGRLSYRPFQWSACSRCQTLVLASGVEDPASAYSEDYYGGNDAKFSGVAGWIRNHFHRARSLLMAGMLPVRGSVYDIGCGDGLFLWQAQQRGLAIFGSEPETKPRNQSSLRLRVEVDSATFANEQLDQFDGITCWQVIEHVNDPADLVRRVRAHLKPNGIFAVSTVNVDSWQSKLFRACWLHLDPPRHPWCGYMRRLEKLLENEGFVVERRRSNWTEFGPVGWVCSFMNSLGLPRDILLHKLKCGFRGPLDPVVLLAAALTPVGVVLAALEALAGRPATFELYCRRGPTAGCSEGLTSAFDK